VTVIEDPSHAPRLDPRDRLTAPVPAHRGPRDEGEPSPPASLYGAYRYPKYQLMMLGD
jgi:hypothetical protein